MTKLNLELFRSAQFAISNNGPYFQNKIEKVPFESPHLHQPSLSEAELRLGEP
jgi:hypothetical protein